MFNAAGIPSPAEPTPVAPPGTPRDFTVNINTASGAVELKWKITNPTGSSGTVYMVERQIGLNGPVQFIGLAGGEKSFTDATIPYGTDAVVYKVTGQRSGVRGGTGEVNVRFGTVGGNSTATVFNTPGQNATGGKIAA